MRDPGTIELAFVLSMMVLILIFGIGAVVIFVRTWRKERRPKTPPPAAPPGPTEE